MVSKKFKHWIAQLDSKLCKPCLDLHGKIFNIHEVPYLSPPLHLFCRCSIQIMNSIRAGEATNNKTNGADFWLKYAKKLPDYYITVKDAINLGYKDKLGNLNIVAPNKMLTKGIYENRNGHLPNSINRIWYEADINYKYGYRNKARILFSNDGLIFVTYDHYRTFTEII